MSLGRGVVAVRPARLALPAVVLAVAWCLPWLGPSGSVLRLGVTSALFAVAGLGLWVVWGRAGQPSFGQAAPLGIGAYTQAVLTVDWGWDPWPAVVAAVFAGTLAGAVLGLPALRVGRDALALATFAVAEALRILESGAEVTHGVGGIRGVPALELAGLSLGRPADAYRPALVLLALAFVAVHWLRRSRLGRAMAVVGADEALARELGVVPGRAKVAAFAIGGALAGLSGAMTASFDGFVSSSGFGAVTSFQLVVAVVLGGLGRPGGAVVGAVLVGLLDLQLQSRPEVRLAVTGAAMIVVVLVRAGALARLAGQIAAAGGRRRRVSVT